MRLTDLSIIKKRSWQIRIANTIPNKPIISLALPPTNTSMKDYKKHFIIPAPPEDLYKALTNPTTIQLWTGEPAEMSTEPGTEFALWSESIVGMNLDFEEDKKIVQEWYFGEQEDASIVTIILHPNKKGTDVELKHTNIPEEAYEDIVEGWNDSYFGALIDFYTE